MPNVHFSRRMTQPPVYRSGGRLYKAKRRYAQHSSARKIQSWYRKRRTSSSRRPARYRGTSSYTKGKSRYASKLTKTLTSLGVIEKSLNQLLAHEDVGVSWCNDHNARYAGFTIGRNNVAGESYAQLGAYNSLTRGDAPGNVTGDYIYCNNINFRLEVRMPSVHETITQLKDNLQMVGPQRFRIMLVFPKLSAQNVASSNFSVTDSLFLDWNGDPFGTGASTTTYPQSGYNIMNAIVNKEKWNSIYDKQIVLQPPEVKQFFSKTGTHVTIQDQVATETALDGGYFNQATINGAGGNFNWPLLQSSTQNHPSVFKKFFSIPINKKVKLDDRASGAIGPENLPLQYRLLILQIYENASNAVNKQVITDVPTMSPDVAGQIGGPCINVQGNATFTDA